MQARRAKLAAMSKGTFIDLFAGIGGFHFALKELGYECLLAVEMNPSCQKVYELNHGIRPIGDIRKLTRTEQGKERDIPELIAELKNALSKGPKRAKALPSINFICAGFPCQPFSKSGHQMGALDKTRGTLFHDILLLTQALKPDHLILENVRNLAGPRHVGTLSTIIASLEELGYSVTKQPVMLSPHHLPQPYGAPQARERVFILATREDLASKKPLPEKVRSDLERVFPAKPRDWSLAPILIKKEDLEGYLLTAQETEWLEAWNAFARSIPGNLPGFPIWLDAMTGKMKAKGNDPAWKKDFIAKNKDFYIENKASIDAWMSTHAVSGFPPSRRKFEWQASRLQSKQDERDIGALAIQLRPSGIRVKPPTYLPALVAITQTSIIGPRVSGNGTGKYRRITPMEAAKLQGMHKIRFGDQPESESYRQLGNAVNVGVVKLLAERLTGESATSAPAAASPQDGESGGKKGTQRRTAPKQNQRKKRADTAPRRAPQSRPAPAAPRAGLRKHNTRSRKRR